MSGVHHAIADQAQRVVAQDAGRNQVQHGLLAADDERVASVVATLEAHHRPDLRGQQVDDLAFSFVAPLCPEDDYRITHDALAPLLMSRCGATSLTTLGIPPRQMIRPAASCLRRSPEQNAIQGIPLKRGSPPLRAEDDYRHP